VCSCKNDVSKECEASIIRVRTDEFGTSLVVTNNRSNLRRNTVCMLRLLVNAEIAASSPILIILMIGGDKFL
jgi:hypothetical protein